MPLDQSHPDFWTEMLQFTPTIHRDVYPAIDTKGEKLQQIARDKVIIVTGAGSGFGEVSNPFVSLRCSFSSSVPVPTINRM